MGTTRDAVAAGVRAELGRQQMSAARLAADIGLTQKALSRRLRSEVSFSVEELLRVAAALNVTAAYLLGEVAA